jgi:hypothetical protein
MDRPFITPQTRVGELLDAYPELESALIAQAPVFEKLKNPVLRRTVARVATLEKAAAIAGIAPRQLVAALRRQAGQPLDDTAADSAERAPADEPPPLWFAPEKVGPTLDADALLASGQTPLSATLTQARTLKGGAILRLTVSFRPVPLIDALRQQGYRTFLRSLQADRFELFVAPGEEPSKVS